MFPDVLIEGYRNFRGERLPQERQKYEELSKGQSPDVLLIACCDSRVAPEVVFGAGPGQIFTIRNVAAIVPPFEDDSGHHGTSSAIEFAVQGLKVKHIVVLGHATCGGIKAYATSAEPLSASNFIGKWVALVEPASKSLEAKGDSLDKPDYLTRLEYAAVSNSLKNLLSFPFVKDRVESGELNLHGAHFGIEKGELRVRDPETGEFHLAVENDGTPRKASPLIGCAEA